MISSLANFPVPNPKLKGRNLFRIALLMAGVLVLTCTLIRPVFAVEGGKGFYLLGMKTNMAGFLPSEGVYFTNPIRII